MRRPEDAADLVIGITPAGEPSARICAAVSRAHGLGVLDLGSDDHVGRDELTRAARWAVSPIGLRAGAGCSLTPHEVVEVLGPRARSVETAVLAWDSSWREVELPPQWRVLVEVTSVAEAVEAARTGARGVIARGGDAGGRVSDLSSFVLLQRLLAAGEVDLPVWLCGGIGRHTAAAAVIGGAAGVVLDTQLALLAEADLPTDLTAAIAASDGTDTSVAGSRRATALGMPLGQDTFLADRFAEEFGSIPRAVRAVRDSIVAALRGDVRPVLGPGAGLSAALGTALPVVQGPMTRVSDRPGFAAAVADAGALPVIALALSSEEQTRSVLTETDAALAGRSWGVGVLGFAPDDVREAQLAVIREIRPKAAVIAGGNPAQAADLENAGITTFLHVASPTLLRQFLDAGARKFVFEGSECGGHVGPRSSFSLWEGQLGVLHAYFADQPAADLQVLFAGGVHDERSAAMVAALAEPLTRLGASAGVLVGTGYLFTEEAVRHGAIGSVFQDAALAAEATAQLETAPGHITRCLPSPFVDTFAAISADLAARGVPRRQVWEQLEQLNVGRLRIASKGLRRHEGDLVAVSQADQAADGLFMAGQVAALRSSTTTIARLHHDVTTGAERFRAERVAAFAPAKPDPVESAAPPPVDVAIVGMACLFPGAADLASFWANILGKVDAITEVPERRWSTSLYHAEDATGANGERTPSKWGGFLGETPFDPLTYGVPPSALAAIEPVQLLALQTAHRALIDAGYDATGPGSAPVDRARVSVVFGAEAGSDLLNATSLRMVLPSYLGSVPAELDEQLPTVTEDSFAGQLTNVIAGRIANRLDFGGASYSVDAACGSSLAAVDSACQELTRGTSDMVLCGGVDLHNAVNDYLLFSSVGALSPTGRCRPFAENADGIALGEGVACVVLKRRADAERDGDRIYAVIDGVGSGSDGRSLGLTAPRPEGQRRALERAFRNARVSPADIGLVEAHGTGTVVGDRIELATLEVLFSEAGAAPGSTALGSVKSQIGHTKCAAGLAGIIKAAMAVYTGVKPPTLHVGRPNAAWQGDTSAFAFHRDPAPWLTPAADRIAGVSAFGFGGTNFHVVLRGHDSAELVRHAANQWPAELFTFKGKDRAAGRREVDRMRELLSANDAHGRPWRLRDLARTAAARADRGRDPVQFAVVASDLDELADRLQIVADHGADPRQGVFAADETAPPAGKLAMVFPGQGSQRPGMLGELFVAFPDLRRFAESTGAVAEAMFPAAAFDVAGEQAQSLRLRDTTMAQPALGVTGLAVHHLLTRLGVVPDMVAGHSYGELAALAAAGCFEAPTLLRLSAARAQTILDAAGDRPDGDLGAMAAVAAGADEVVRALGDACIAGDVVLANLNSPNQSVLSGPTLAVRSAVEALRAEGLSLTELPVACAFHSPLVAGAVPRFADVLAEHPVAEPRVPVWSNRTGGRYPVDPDAVRAELAAQIGAPVRFADEIQAMYADGARIFVEAGPGRVLSGMIDSILDGRPHDTITIESSQGAGLPGLLTALARLAVLGVDVRTSWLTSGRDAVDVSRLTPPRRPGWTVDGQTVRTVDGKYLPGGLAPAQRVEVTMTDKAGPAGQAGRDALVGEFLRSSRELIAAQRDVLLGLLGTAPTTATSLMPAPQAVPSAAVAVTAAPPLTAPTPADPLTTVVDLIVERTGYPAEMIEPDLDLEADLSIDSIKRTEIAGELAARLGLDGTGTPFDALARLRTTRAIAAWITDTTATTSAADAAPSGPAPWPDAARPLAALAQPVPAAGKAPTRFTMKLMPAPEVTASKPSPVAGAKVTLVGGDPELVTELSERLTTHGAAVTAIGPGDEITGALDGLVLLDPLSDAAEPVLPTAFSSLRSALMRRPRWVIAVAPKDQPSRAGRAAGLRGLFRTLVTEYPETAATLVEVARGAAHELAEAITTELLAASGDPVVVVEDGRRHTFVLTPTGLGPLAATGAGPAGDGTAELAAVGLTRDSVVLLIGGARGITSRLASTLASSTQCRVELAGRTPFGGQPEDPATALAADLPSLRAALAGLGHRDPAAIDLTAREILARREVAATVAELSGHGSEVTYHALDVLDTETVRQLIKRVHTEHGRIDGVVYAAGVIDDKLIEDKDDASFARVYSTKVDGAAAMLEELAGLPSLPGFVVLFGSVAAVLGNRGQADYAAANDALEAMGVQWSARTGGRALTVHWGPWAPSGANGGMVTTELARTYQARGIELIDPAEGVAALVRELAWGDPEVTAVVLNAAVRWGEGAS
ncbi:type I polyketide synthase [Amycolatopsis sp. CA-126428]|uniref:type I polyketide synthase n=1 Tax=Amycolatopsis sp. CA-126428 TaxID=2073158 RepID=UPI000CD1D726|nr:type I polyketide synthase [Amycolatopsis sp. CA-126428]